jgi:membrane-bound serine protease (ClpP class)
MMELSFTAVLLLLAVGILLLAIEVFVTPGMAVKGVLGLACIAGAIFFAYWQHGPLKGTLVLGGAALVLAGGGWVASRTMGRRLVLGASIGGEGTDERDFLDLVGAEGVALSPLRPSGIARFGERRVDVTAEPEFLDPGTRVVVVSVSGTKIKVERAA